MESRKLVKSGNSSLVIAVPKEWIAQNRLNAGDRVYVEENKGSLVIEPKFRKTTPEKKEAVVNIGGKIDKTIIRDISLAYLENYDIIIIKGNDLARKAKLIKNHILSLVALELVEESSEKIVAKSFLNMYDVDINLLVTRIDNITRSMMIDTRSAVSDRELASSVVERDFEVNRLNFLITKILKSAYKDKALLHSMNISEIELLQLWEINIHMEKIADRVKNIISLVPELKKDQARSFLDLMARIDQIYRKAMKTFYTQSAKISDEIAEEQKELKLYISEYMRKNPGSICSQIAVNAFNLLSNVNDIARIVRYMN